MTKTNRFKALAVVAAMALALCLLAWVAVQPAGAAFPGTNGKIAYYRAFDSWTKNASLASQETKLLDDAGDVAYSPDGSRVAFERANEIYVTNANGTGTPRRLTNDCLLDSAPVWSHDGTRIAFVRRSDDDPRSACDGRYNIWTMNADGTNQRQMTSEGGFSSPSWSVPVLPDAPDGKILYKGGGLDIWTMNPDGNGKTKLTYTCPTENGICDNAAGNPTFSPDGTEIAAEYFGDIFVIPSGGGESRVILGTPKDGYPGTEEDPTWSPDGTMIAFEHNDIGGSGSDGISWARADGTSTTPTQITNNMGEQDPDWQPATPQCTITGAGAITGTPGRDVICGSAGNDTINGAGGNDIIMGGNGNDTLVVPAGRATLNGGAGKDAASFAGSTTGIEASLVGGFAHRVGTDPLEGVAFVGIEGLIGSGLDDELTGSNLANKLVGGDGADQLLGLGGRDGINSRDGARNDTVNGGAGTDACVTDRREVSIRGCE